MRWVGISGSPRRGGNTELVIQEALRGAGVEQPESELVRLNELAFRGCQGCFGCRVAGSTGCVVEDELQTVYRRLHRAELLVLGSPIYYGYVTGQMKSFLDRCYALKDGRGESRLAKGARALLVLVQGAPGEDHYLWTQSSLEKVLTGYGLSVETLVVPGCEEMGAVRHRPQLLEKARQAGRRAATG